MITTHSLTRSYGHFRAVDGLNLTVEDGEIFGFLGLNGAGKTTAMRMMCGLLRPDSGGTSIGPVQVRGPQDAHRLIPILSFVSQEMRFYEQANLHELIGIYAALAGVSPDVGMGFARQSGVPLDRTVARFSPGQQRKAQLAIALLKSPRYLFLDEPTAGLDPHGVAEMRDILRQLHQGGTTIFLSTHVLSEVQVLCTSFGILHQGRLCDQGRVTDDCRIEEIFMKATQP